MSSLNSSITNSFSLDDYREVFEEMDDIIMILQKDGVIDYVNRALGKILDLKGTLFTGTNIKDSLLSLAQSKKSEDQLKELFSTRHLETTYTLNNGNLLILEWKLKKFRHAQGKKVFAIIRDITAERKHQLQEKNYTKQLQNLVLDHQQQMAQQQEQQDSLDRSKSLFLSRVAHELRTPLTALRGYSELLNDEELEKQERLKYLRVIQRNADEMLSMVDETLSMLKLEQNRYVVHDQEINLHQFIHEILETCYVLAEHKDIELNLKLSQQRPDTLHSDPQIIRQILINLIGNAIKFTEKGGVTISIKQRSHHGGVKKTLYFYVEDTGCGIPRDKQQLVFKRFEQHRNAHNMNQRGTGLGLAIALQLSKLLGGQLKLLSSELGKGSIFVFSLALRSME